MLKYLYLIPLKFMHNVPLALSIFEGWYISVDRDIQLRELHACGESGDLLEYSRNTYQNTASHIKQDGRLVRQFQEHKGNRQGHKRAAGHFKCYINLGLATANSSILGFWIGPICVSCICVADDTYVVRPVW